MMFTPEGHIMWCEAVRKNKGEWLKVNDAGDGVNLGFLLDTIYDLQNKVKEFRTKLENDDAGSYVKEALDARETIKKLQEKIDICKIWHKTYDNSSEEE